MNLVFVDVEADGPCPGLYSMVSFGAVKLNDSSFLGTVKPISDKWIPEALAISKINREVHLTYMEPTEVMEAFKIWLGDKPTFISDNPAFDWQFINYYFHRFIGSNPFGFSARRIGDFYAGVQRNFRDHNNWKQYRKTNHDHNPVNDARGNREAFNKICSMNYIKIN